MTCSTTTWARAARGGAGRSDPRRPGRGRFLLPVLGGVLLAAQIAAPAMGASSWRRRLAGDAGAGSASSTRSPSSRSGTSCARSSAPRRASRPSSADLSFIHVGQIWYAFGWEIQLLETGFLGIFCARSSTVGPSRDRLRRARRSRCCAGSPSSSSWAPGSSTGAATGCWPGSTRAPRPISRSPRTPSSPRSG